MSRKTNSVKYELLLSEDASGSSNIWMLWLLYSAGSSKTLAGILGNWLKISKAVDNEVPEVSCEKNEWRLDSVLLIAGGIHMVKTLFLQG